MSALDFNAMLLGISNQLSADELEKIKFLCRGSIGKRELEKTSSGLRLFQLLAERGELAADRRDLLSRHLRHIQRHDLADKLDSFQCGDGDSQLDQAEREKLDIAAEVVTEKLGRYWRKLGRKLGLNDVKLDSIQRRHPTELEETVVELLREWRRCRGAEARTTELIEALRACQFNLIADTVQDKLAERGY